MFPRYFNITVSILVIITFLSACDTTDNDAVIATVKTERVFPSLQSTIADSDFVKVEHLFRKNNLSLANLKAYRFQENISYYVRCFQYYNSLELFTNDVIYIFDTDDNYNSLVGEIINSIEIDFSPKVSMEESSNLFYSEINANWNQKDSLESYSKKGFNAELGIFDLNSGQSYAQKDFILTWRLTVNNQQNYPKAYIRADQSQLIYYDNGIIIN